MAGQPDVVWASAKLSHPVCMNWVMDERTTPGTENPLDATGAAFGPGYGPDRVGTEPLFDELGRPRALTAQPSHPSRGRVRQTNASATVSGYDSARRQIQSLSAEHRALAEASFGHAGTDVEFQHRRTVAAARARHRRDGAVGDDREHHSSMRDVLVVVV
jgi:hypothetical protein